MSRVLEAAKLVYPWLKFTMDLAEDNETGAVPMLDLQVWTDPKRSGPKGTRQHWRPRRGLTTRAGPSRDGHCSPGPVLGFL